MLQDAAASRLKESATMLVATHTTKPLIASKEWHQMSFYLVGGCMLVALLGLGSMSIFGPDIHRWHDAELFAQAIILLGGSLLSLFWQPQEKPLLAQFFVLATLFLATMVSLFEPKIAIMFIALVLLLAVYPDIRGLLSFKREGPICKSLLTLSLLTAIFLLPKAWLELHYQILGMRTGDIHALQFHWVNSVSLMVLLVVAGLLTATKWPGWRELGLITGGTFCYLGLNAMVAPYYAGSWGGAGGLFAVIAGIWYILITALEAQRTPKLVPAPEPVRVRKVVVSKPVMVPVPAFALATVPAARTRKLTADAQPTRKTQKLLDVFGTLDALPVRRTQHLVGA